MLLLHGELLPVSLGLLDRERVIQGLQRPSMLLQDSTVHLCQALESIPEIEPYGPARAGVFRTFNLSQGLVERMSMTISLMLPASCNLVASGPLPMSNA